VADPGDDPNPAITESCGDNATYVDTAAADSFDCTFADGPASSTVKVTANDGDLSNNIGSDEVDVTVSNVAPTVNLTGSATANEGETKNYTYTVSDPGDDTFTVNAGYPDCDAGVTDNGTLVTGSVTASALGGSFQCRFPDGPATANVKIKVTDSDLASTTDSESVQIVAIANVAPTVVLTGAASADEGQTKTYTYTVTDPGDDPNPTITETCGTGGVPTDTATANHFECTFPDGPATPKVTVTANDGDDTGSDDIDVSVVNVAPDITSFTGTDSFAGPLAFTPSVFTTDFTDPGRPTDTHKAEFTWSDSASVQTVNPFVTGQKVTHTFAAGCDRGATVKVIDKDTDFDTASTTVDVGTGAWLPPLANQPVSDKLKNGQVLPVKVRLTDCAGATVNGLSPYIELAKGDLTAVPDDATETIAIASVSSADTGQVMRQMADGSYIYNLRVSLPSGEIGKDWTIIVYPYGKSAGGATLRHVIVATSRAPPRIQTRKPRAARPA
jgi:hypothetical protein